MKPLKNLWTGLLTLSSTLVALPARAAVDIKADLSGKFVQSDIDVPTLINNVVSRILEIAGGIAVIYLIWAGITYITGGEKGAEKGKTMLTNALVGLAIIILAYAIFSAVTGLISSVGKAGA
jgi:hypothetical protein